MASIIPLQPYEFWGMLFGWVFAVLFGLMTFAYIKLTPAKVFLKAWLSKRPVAWVKYRTGIGEFKVGKEDDPGSMDVDGLGYVSLTEGSQVREKRSGRAVFDVFGEYGATIPKEYAPIIQELREAGFKINTFKDYQHLILLASNEKYEEDYLNSFQFDFEKKEAKERISKIKKLKIEVKPYKSYSTHDLAYMFPNNISPVYVDAKVTNAVNRNLKKMKFNQQMWLYVGMGALLITLAIVIIFKVIKQPEPQVIIQTLDTGVQLAKTNTTIPM